MRWLRFFVGTPRRLFTVIVVVMVLVVATMIEPRLVNLFWFASWQLGNAIIAPLIGPLLFLLIILYGYKVMFRGILSGGNSRKRRR
jgi:hypothetical protein